MINDTSLPAPPLLAPLTMLSMWIRLWHVDVSGCHRTNTGKRRPSTSRRSLEFTQSGILTFLRDRSRESDHNMAFKLAISTKWIDLDGGLASHDWKYFGVALSKMTTMSIPCSSVWWLFGCVSWAKPQPWVIPLNASIGVAAKGFCRCNRSP